MPTICPNCLRLVRTGANYCGFCGTNLVPPAPVDHSGPLAVELETTEQELANEARTAQPVARGGNARRTILILIIILLCLVLVAAFVAHFWSAIGQYVLPLLDYIRRR